MSIDTIENGGFQDAGGNSITGTITFQLSAAALVSGTGQVVENRPITYNVTSGNIQSGATLWGVDQLTPSGLYYIVTIYDSTGVLVRGPENWVISGTSPISLTGITPSTPSVSYAGAVLLSPSGSQTITTGNLLPESGNSTQQLGSSTAPWVVYGTTGTFSGAVTAEAFGNVAYADQFPGSDIGAQINAALTFLGSDGGVVMLPAGTYTLTTAVTVSYPVVIRGRGRAATIIEVSGNTTPFTVSSGAVSFYDLTLDNTGTPTSGCGVSIGAYNNVKLQDVFINNFYVGIVNTGGNYLTMYQCSVSGCVSDAIQLQAGGCIFVGNWLFYNGGNGVTLTVGGSFQLSMGNQLYACQGYGYKYDGNQTAQTLHTGDVVDSCGNTGFLVQNMKEVVIENGWVGSCGVNFSGKNPNYSSFNSNVLAGIVFDSSNLGGIIISGNLITNNAGMGIWAYEPSNTNNYRVEISDNLVFGNGQSGSNGQGIGVTGPWDNVIISGNHSWNYGGTTLNPQENGLYLSGTGEYLEVIGNDFTGNNTAALNDSSTATTKKFIGNAGIVDTGWVPLANGSSSVVATGLTADYNSGTAYTLVTPTTNKSVYRVTLMQSVTQAATTNSTMPSLTVGWTDSASVARTNAAIATNTGNANTVYEVAHIICETNGSTNVTITSAGYASNGATAMQYDLIATCEQLV